MRNTWIPVSYSNVVCRYVLTLGDALYTQMRYKKYVLVVLVLMDVGVLKPVNWRSLLAERKY